LQARAQVVPSLCGGIVVGAGLAGEGPLG
jgi:hypothetical protein